MRVILIEKGWRIKITEDDYKFFTGLRCGLEMERICRSNNWPYNTMNRNYSFLDKERIIKWLYNLYAEHEESFEKLFEFWETYPPSFIVSSDLDELIKIDNLN
jgi:hypothetical protein